MKRITRLFISLFFLLVAFAVMAQVGNQVAANQELKTKKKPNTKNLATPDSINPTINNSLKVDSIKTDSINPKKKGMGLSNVVNYEATDSMIFFGGSKKAQLYGPSKVTYENIQLDANFMRMEMDSSLIYANGVADSSGKTMGDPIFKEREEEYKSKTLKYNFNTQKGFITNVVTQQGEGYIVGGQTKKMPDNSFFMKDCKYTTCNNHEHPHFYLNITKAKVRHGKDIVAGPAYMVIEDVPLPLALPFAYFPFTDQYSSGVIIPTFGDELQRGFFLREGGYYFAINDYMDLALTGEVFTKGSWGINAASSYRKRYAFSGNFNIGFLTTVLGEKGLPDYSVSNDFRLSLTHTQDPKSNPDLTLSASVNLSTSNYNRNDFGSIYNPEQHTQNTKSSTVNLGYRIPNSPWSFSTALNVSQRSQDSTISVSFPDLNISMSRIYPFKRKVVVGSERWYEKISLSYTGKLSNNITTRENKILKSNLIKDWKNGMNHSVPISATFTLFKYINVTPSFSFNTRWYSNRIDQEWDTQKSVVKQDTTWGFYNVYDFNGSISASTKLYGFYKPLPFLGDKVEMIRHVFTPSVSFSARPDFGDPAFGFWKQYTRVDAQGRETKVDYSPYSHGIFGTAQRGKQGTVSFSMSNNVEMKIKSKRDTSGIAKISLIDNLSMGISYNMAADSMNWSNISPSLRIKLTKDFTLNLNATFDTYTYQLDANQRPVRVNVTRWEKYGPGALLGRLSSTGTSFSYTFNNDTFKKLFGPKEEKKEGDTPEEEKKTDAADVNPIHRNDVNNPMPQKPEKEIPQEVDADGFLRFKMPWSFSVNYSMQLGYGEFNKQKLEYDYKLTHNLSFSGNLNLGKGWSFNFSSSYDFDQNKIAYMNCNITRDLHCWRMTAGFVPVGPYKSYYFTLSASSQLLQDLKWDKRSSPYDVIKWY